ncbi:hypothetical protein KXD40_000487 [Peronospora effusa]|nr:hypothetical protein KXD40_000487 [Peronospora effusa]
MKIYYTKACCLKSARKDRMHHYRGRLETNLVMESLLILTNFANVQTLMSFYYMTHVTTDTAKML